MLFQSFSQLKSSCTSRRKSDASNQRAASMGAGRLHSIEQKEGDLNGRSRRILESRPVNLHI